jgi:hypothetical protein
MNLLPNKEKETLKKNLKLRFLILALFLLSISFLLGLIMLLPSYFLALGNLSKISLENSLSTLKNDDTVKTILNLPQEINSKLKLLQANSKSVSVTDTVSKIIKYLPAGVKLNSVSFAKNQNYKDKDGTVVMVSGVALSRDSLVLFASSLKESGLFSDVEVPVSSLTKDRNLPFSMNIFIGN